MTFLEGRKVRSCRRLRHLIYSETIAHLGKLRAQRPPGQVSEIKQRERFAFENGSQIEAHFKHDVCDGQKGVWKTLQLSV